MTTTALRRELEIVSPTRQRVMGGLFILLGLIIWVAFARGVDPDVVTKFGLTPGGFKKTIPDMVLPTSLTVNILAFLSVLMGVLQLTMKGGFRKRTNLVLAVVVGAFIFAFLTWATAGKSLNLGGLLNTTLSKAVPLTLGAMAGVLCERAGVVNIAIEGMMLMGAMVGALVGSIAESLWIGLAAAVLSGLLLGAIHAVLSIKYKTNQIISGTVINIFATGMTSYISAKFMQTYQELNNPGIFKGVPIPIPLGYSFVRSDRV